MVAFSVQTLPFNATNNVFSYSDACFWKAKGSLAWPKNYEETMFFIWDIVVEEEHKCAEDIGQALNQSAFQVNNFSPDEIGIVSMVAARLATEESVKEVGKASTVTERPTYSTTTPLVPLQETTIHDPIIEWSKRDAATILPELLEAWAHPLRKPYLLLLPA